jgi:hypothetical protein
MKQAIEHRGDHEELVAIEGEQLSAVTFVQDYVQLHFDGPMITAITLPVAIARDTRWGIGDIGYRDQLCGLIARNVVRAYVRPGDRLQIDFEGGASLIVSLKPKDYRAAEAVIFSDGKSEQWAAW